MPGKQRLCMPSLCSYFGLCCDSNCLWFIVIVFTSMPKLYSEWVHILTQSALMLQLTTQTLHVHRSSDSWAWVQVFPVLELIVSSLVAIASTPLTTTLLHVWTGSCRDAPGSLFGFVRLLVHALFSMLFHRLFCCICTRGAFWIIGL